MGFDSELFEDIIVKERVQQIKEKEIVEIMKKI
jgi:hypothetical protein